MPAGMWQGERVTASGAEWIMNRGRIPVADYQKFPAQFNPTNFNATEWVKLAKDAGMKYLVITAKHHDGFAMYRSQASKFNIYDATPIRNLVDIASKGANYLLNVGPNCLGEIPAPSIERLKEIGA